MVLLEFSRSFSIVPGLYCVLERQHLLYLMRSQQPCRRRQLPLPGPAYTEAQIQNGFARDS